MKKLCILIAGLFLLGIGLGKAQYKILHTFNPTHAGENPFGSVVSSVTRDTLFGMTFQGGANTFGCIYLIKSDGTGYKDIYDFTKSCTGNGGGSSPYVSLTVKGDTIFGITNNGGAYSYGNIFSIKTNGNGYTDLFDFSGTEGGNPVGSLTPKGDTLFGMTADGGTYSYGTIFRILTNGKGFDTIRNFSGTYGDNPYGSLLLSVTKDTLFGMTSQGYTYQNGNVFSIQTNGKNFHNMISFNGTNGGVPFGALTPSVTGDTLFGMTQFGGAHGFGNIFYITTTGAIFDTLFNFNRTDGYEPAGALTLVHGDSLFGMTYSGGTSGDGVAFSILTTGKKFYDMVEFSGTNGKNPYGSFALSPNGEDLIGITPSGGVSGIGNLFTIQTNGNSYKNAFQWKDSDGFAPVYNNVIVVGTKFYGMTEAGGLNGAGMIFSMNTDGSNYTDVWDFKDSGSALNANGAYPYGSLTASVTGDTLFGMTEQGGSKNEGTVFSIHSDGTKYSDLYDFDISLNGGYGGTNPYGSLVRKGDSLFGMTNGGYNYPNEGEMFSIQTNGKNFNAMAYFDGASVPQGARAYGDLTFSLTKDTLFGMTEQGGSGYGVLFSVQTNGNNYNGYIYLDNNNSPEGAYPYGSLTLSTSGKSLFGLTEQGAYNNDGVILSWQPGNSIGALYFGNAPYCLNPYGSLTLSEDTLYGMSYAGGSNGIGNIFSIPAGGGSPVDMYDFDGTHGQHPKSSLTYSNGVLYGMTTQGGTYSDGVVFGKLLRCTMTTTPVVVSNTCILMNDGIATANATTGSAPYTYLWNDGHSQKKDTATGLSAGTYVVKVTDFFGCINTASVVIKTITSVSISANVTSNVTCINGSNGAISTTLTNGVPPFTYTWSPLASTTATATGLSAGTYKISVTDFCSNTSTVAVTVTQPAVLTLSASITNNVSCNGAANGVSSSTVNGGTLPYTYLWSDASSQTTASATGLSAATYTITIHDSCGNSKTASVIITQPTVLSIIATVVKNIRCNGGNIGIDSVSASGGTSPYTYLWSDANSQTTAKASGLTAGTYTITVKDNNGCSATASNSIPQPLSLLANASVTSNVSCNGGSNGKDSASASGGTSPYTYLWSDANSQTTAKASGLTAGTYTITITDNNGCSASATNSITQPIALHSNATITGNVNCNGGSNGSDSAYASGGTSPYTYLWSDVNSQTTAKASGLTAGTYTITVEDNNGCSVTAANSITQPTVLVANAIVSADVSCNGLGNGKDSVSASGGTGPYTYLWSDANSQTTAKASGLTAGTYTITVEDNNGCSISAANSITQPLSLFANAAITRNVSCNGGNNGSDSVSVSGGTSPYTYLWSDANSQTAVTASGLSIGTYSVSVKDNNGCSTTASGVITQPLPLAVTHDSISADVNCSGVAGVTVRGGTSPYTYQWTPGGHTNDTINHLCAGIYTCTVTDSSGCSLSTSITINNCVNNYDEPICIVTIDTANNKCEVVWGRTNSPPSGGYGYYKIYKDSTLGYAFTHSQHLDSLSEYIDLLSDPSAAPVSYELSTVDSCGESVLSSPHTTMYLTTSAGINVYILNWTAYVGFATTKYRIFRGPSLNSMIQIDSVPSNVLTYHDTLPPLGYYYGVEAVSPNGACSPTHRPGNLLGSFSNGFNTGTLLGISAIKNDVTSLEIYPNPTNGIFTLSYSVSQGDNLQISLINELGQVIYKEQKQAKTGTNTEQLNLGNLAAGIYSLRLQSTNGIIVRKVVKIN